MYIMVDLDASLTFNTCLNAFVVLKTRLAQREETELARCQVEVLERLWRTPNLTRLNFDRDAHDSS